MNIVAKIRKLPRLGTAAASALEQMVEQQGELLNPRAVVEAARDPDSALHPYFTWDDGVAAEQWRLFEAGVLVRRIKVFIVRPSTEARTVEVHLERPETGAISTRRFVSLPSQRNSAGGYLPVERVLSDVERRGELLATALRELSGLRDKYQILEELADVWTALERVA